MPTSITTAPGLTMSARDHARRARPRRPARRLARRPRRGRACASGRSSRSRWRPAAAAPSACRQVRAADHRRRRAPSSSTPASAQQLHHARRRARPQRPGGPSASSPAFDRRQPVDVLGAVDQRRSAASVEVVGQRQLQQDPADALVGVELRDQLGSTSLVRRRRRQARGRSDSIPTSAQASLLVRT